MQALHARAEVLLLFHEGCTLDKVLRENEVQLKRARKMPGHEAREADPNHEPAWKRRRRS